MWSAFCSFAINAPHNEGVWGSGGVATDILNPETRRRKIKTYRTTAVGV
jgi:hypothetical protein